MEREESEEDSCHESASTCQQSTPPLGNHVDKGLMMFKRKKSLFKNSDEALKGVCSEGDTMKGMIERKNNRFKEKTQEIALYKMKSAEALAQMQQVTTMINRYEYAQQSDASQSLNINLDKFSDESVTSINLNPGPNNHLSDVWEDVLNPVRERVVHVERVLSDAEYPLARTASEKAEVNLRHGISHFKCLQTTDKDNHTDPNLLKELLEKEQMSSSVLQKTLRDANERAEQAEAELCHFIEEFEDTVNAYREALTEELEKNNLLEDDLNSASDHIKHLEQEFNDRLITLQDELRGDLTTNEMLQSNLRHAEENKALSDEIKHLKHEMEKYQHTLHDQQLSHSRLDKEIKRLKKEAEAELKIISKQYELNLKNAQVRIAEERERNAKVMQDLAAVQETYEVQMMQIKADMTEKLQTTMNTLEEEQEKNVSLQEQVGREDQLQQQLESLEELLAKEKRLNSQLHSAKNTACTKATDMEMVQAKTMQELEDVISKEQEKHAWLEEQLKRARDREECLEQEYIEQLDQLQMSLAKEKDQHAKLLKDKEQTINKMRDIEEDLRDNLAAYQEMLTEEQRKTTLLNTELCMINDSVDAKEVYQLEVETLQMGLNNEQRKAAVLEEEKMKVLDQMAHLELNLKHELQICEEALSEQQKQNSHLQKRFDTKKANEMDPQKQDHCQTMDKIRIDLEKNKMEKERLAVEKEKALAEMKNMEDDLKVRLEAFKEVYGEEQEKITLLKDELEEAKNTSEVINRLLRNEILDLKRENCKILKQKVILEMRMDGLTHEPGEAIWSKSDTDVYFGVDKLVCSTSSELTLKAFGEEPEVISEYLGINDNNNKARCQRSKRTFSNHHKVNEQNNKNNHYTSLNSSIHKGVRHIKKKTSNPSEFLIQHDKKTDRGPAFVNKEHQTKKVIKDGMSQLNSQEKKGYQSAKSNDYTMQTKTEADGVGANNSKSQPSMATSKVQKEADAKLKEKMQGVSLEVNLSLNHLADLIQRSKCKQVRSWQIIKNMFMSGNVISENYVKSLAEHTVGPGGNDQKNSAVDIKEDSQNHKTKLDYCCTSNNNNAQSNEEKYSRLNFLDLQQKSRLGSVLGLVEECMSGEKILVGQEHLLHLKEMVDEQNKSMLEEDKFLESLQTRIQEAANDWALLTNQIMTSPEHKDKECVVPKIQEQAISQLFESFSKIVTIHKTTEHDNHKVMDELKHVLKNIPHNALNQSPKKLSCFDDKVATKVRYEHMFELMKNENDIRLKEAEFFKRLAAANDLENKQLIMSLHDQLQEMAMASEQNILGLSTSSEQIPMSKNHSRVNNPASNESRCCSIQPPGVNVQGMEDDNKAHDLLAKVSNQGADDEKTKDLLTKVRNQNLALEDKERELQKCKTKAEALKSQLEIKREHLDDKTRSLDKATRELAEVREDYERECHYQERLKVKYNADLHDHESEVKKLRTKIHALESTHDEITEQLRSSERRHRSDLANLEREYKDSEMKHEVEVQRLRRQVEMAENTAKDIDKEKELEFRTLEAKIKKAQQLLENLQQERHYDAATGVSPRGTPQYTGDTWLQNGRQEIGNEFKHKKAQQFDTSNPLLQYGYPSNHISVSPHRPTMLSPTNHLSYTNPGTSPVNLVNPLIPNPVDPPNLNPVSPHTPLTGPSLMNSIRPAAHVTPMQPTPSPLSNDPGKDMLLQVQMMLKEIKTLGGTLDYEANLGRMGHVTRYRM